MKNNSQKLLDRRQKGKNLLSNAYCLMSNERGFTLVELLIYMGLLTVLILIFTDIFTSIIDNQLSSRNTSSVADDGRYIYSRFIYDVAHASAIIQPALPGSSSSQLTFTKGGQNYTYSLVNGNLLITDQATASALNSSGSSVSGLLFTRVGTTSAKTTVRINFTITGLITSRGILDTQSFQTTAGLR